MKLVAVEVPVCEPSRKSRYLVTPTSSVDALHDRVAEVWPTAETERPPGVEGEVVSLGGGMTGGPAPPPQGPGVAVTFDWAEALPAASIASTAIVTGTPQERFPIVWGLSRGRRRACRRRTVGMRQRRRRRPTAATTRRPTMQ